MAQIAVADHGGTIEVQVGWEDVNHLHTRTHDVFERMPKDIQDALTAVMQWVDDVLEPELIAELTSYEKVKDHERAIARHNEAIRALRGR